MLLVRSGVSWTRVFTWSGHVTAAVVPLGAACRCVFGAAMLMLAGIFLGGAGSVEVQDSVQFVISEPGVQIRLKADSLDTPASGNTFPSYQLLLDEENGGQTLPVSVSSQTVPLWQSERLSGRGRTVHRPLLPRWRGAPSMACNVSLVFCVCAVSVVWFSIPGSSTALWSFCPQFGEIFSTAVNVCLQPNSLCWWKFVLQPFSPSAVKI